MNEPDLVEPLFLAVKANVRRKDAGFAPLRQTQRVFGRRVHLNFRAHARALTARQAVTGFRARTALY